MDGTLRYIYGHGLIGRVDASNNQLWYLPDGLGSTANVRDASGNAVAAYTYDVYGAISAQTGSSDNYFDFAGEQSDSESGYDYLRARYYDPSTGRMLGADPAGPDHLSPSTMNRFAYVLNNPGNLLDPTGRTVVCTDHEYTTADGSPGISQSCSNTDYPGGMFASGTSTRGSETLKYEYGKYATATATFFWTDAGSIVVTDITYDCHRGANESATQGGTSTGAITCSEVAEIWARDPSGNPYQAWNSYSGQGQNVPRGGLAVGPDPVVFSQYFFPYPGTTDPINGRVTQKPYTLCYGIQLHLEINWGRNNAC